jgi:RNA polymerase sigma factor (sigma-70 family)
VKESCTTAAVQDFLNELANASSGAPPAESVIRALLGRSVTRLQMLCSVMLHRKYGRLTQPPLNLEVDELLSSVVERLIRAMYRFRPETTRHFFALANQHIRWELNDLARRLDKQAPAIELHESRVAAHEKDNDSSFSPNIVRMLDAVEGLPDDEREIFGLVQVQGLTHTEAAAVLGVSPKTVQRRLNRGLMLLTKALGDLAPE